MDGYDLDRETSRAWRRFQSRLADHLAEMGDDDVLVVETESADESGGAAPYVQFAGFGEGCMLRGEVSSNAWLAEAHALTEEGEETLCRLGWCPPTVSGEDPAGAGSANFFLDVPVAEADRVAYLAVRALRDVFGVAHPAFLAAGDLGEDPDAPRTPLPGAETEPDEPLAVVPESADHLRELVDRALTPLFGGPPEHDADGDVPVPWGSCVVYVRVVEEAPVIDLFGVVAEGITDHERAGFEVNVLNRDHRFVKFFVVDDRVVARMLLPAYPFVPEHLRSMLTGMSAKLDEVDDDLVARIGGRPALGDPADEPDGGSQRVEHDPDAPTRTPESALRTLLELDAGDPGTLDPALAAEVCGFDPTLVVSLLEETERQENAWRAARDRAADAGDQDEAGACAHEMWAWAGTTELLRRALRLTVDRGSPPCPAGGPGTTRDGGVGPRTRRTARSEPRPREDGPAADALDDAG